MKILAVGGGSGGHVLPIVAVFKSLLNKNKDIQLSFWCDKKFGPQAFKIMQSEFNGNIKVSTIYSGKFRRYNHLTFFQHLAIPSIVFNNIIDMFRIIMGIIQSFCKLIIERPDVIFCKGGFVCVPVGLSAYILRIPIVIHDSDAHAGLANRILSRFAKRIATGAPLEFYNYPKDISTYVGIPIKKEFKPYSLVERKELKKALGFNTSKSLIVVTGGGLGAARLNNAIVKEASKLAKKTQILLISGMGQYKELKEITENKKIKDFYLEGFLAGNMWQYLAAADIVVARAGATSNLELSSLAKPTILVPNARLTGGHQLKNAQVYAKNKAVIIVSDDEIEDNPNKLSDEILKLISNPKKMEEMSDKFVKFAKPKAADDMASIILEIANK